MSTQAPDSRTPGSLDRLGNLLAPQIRNDMLFGVNGSVCLCVRVLHVLRVLLGIELGVLYIYWASISSLNYVPDVFE